MILDGNCPETHGIRLPTLLFETTYEIGPFIGVPGRYIWSTGDTTGNVFPLSTPALFSNNAPGLGTHADFKSGWKKDQLQEGLNTCLYTDGRVDSCHAFTINNNPGECHLVPPEEVKGDSVRCSNSMCGGATADGAEEEQAQPAATPVANTQQRIAVGRQQNAEAPAPPPPEPPAVSAAPEPELPPTFVTKILTVTDYMTLETTEWFTLAAAPTPEPLRRRGLRRD
jgi:hypothetical protein